MQVAKNWVKRSAGIWGAACAALTAAFLAVAPAPAQAQTEAQVVQKLNDYLRALTTMQGRFVQLSPNAPLMEGDFAIRRPGRMRFAYHPPNEALFIADGFWAVVLESVDDPSQDRFPLSATPLHIFLKKDVDLQRDGVIAGVQILDDQYRITAVDPDGEAQGDITLFFRREPLQLIQWTVTDPLGQTTTVVLRDAVEGGPVDINLFSIPDPDDDE